MLNTISKNWRLSIFDYAKSLRTNYYYHIYKQSFNWSREKLKNYQNNKLQNLIRHSYNNVPYYKHIFDKKGIKPDDIRSSEDLRFLPVLNREDIINNYIQIKDANTKYKPVFPSTSSGTTGTPLKYVHDTKGESAGVAAVYALYNLSGREPGVRNIHIWGNPESIKKWESVSSRVKRRLLQQKNYPAFLLNDPSNYPELLKIIKTYKPVFIDGYTSAIGSFASWLASENIVIDNIKAVFTTAENLTLPTKTIIEKQIGPVSDLYGCGEINGIAIQPVNKARYYVLEPHVIVESQTNNGINELIVTDLDNYIMPFIRYKPGDTIDDLRNVFDDSNLPFVSFKDIDGRISDYIKLPSGKKIHPINVLGGTTLRQFPQIRRHKAIWNGIFLKFQIECNENIDLDLLYKKVSHSLKDYKVDFEIEIKNKLLPSSNGKFKYIEITESQN